MNIYISSGVGSGPTKLAAFDAALNNAGIANYNLIKLSSVIPPQSKIIKLKTSIPTSKMPGQWGDRLYVVMAEIRVDTPNTHAWAGIGWVQDKTSGRGLFVEHEGNSEASIRNDIKQSLEGLMKNRNIKFGPMHIQVVGIKSEIKPVSALVCAVYQTSDWENIPEHF